MPRLIALTAVALMLGSPGVRVGPVDGADEAGTGLSAQTSAAGAPNLTITAVGGIKVGHVTLSERPTGCTVVLVDGDATGGVSQRGGAPGTRETDLLRSENMVDKVNAIVLSGGSAFGLDAATGTSR